MPFGGSVLPGIYTVIRSVFLDEATFTDFIPQNDGIFRPINVIAREGSIFNPTFPRSALSRVCPIMRASDCAILALSEVVPDQVCAGCSAVGVGVYTGYIPEQEEYWVHVEINEGAYGGRSGKDGIDAIDVLTVNSRNTPIEETDWLFPLHTVRYELRDDVEPAPGQVARRPRHRAREPLPEGRRVHLGDRPRLRPARRACSAAARGARCGSRAIDPDGGEHRARLQADQLHDGRRARRCGWEQSCGGGYGDPLERDPAAVLRDWLRRADNDRQCPRARTGW